VDSLSVTLAAMADPTRRSILRRLTLGPASVTDLARPFDISQQAISKHLAYLEDAQLIDKRREGRLHICSLNPAPLQEVAEWTGEFRKFWETSFQRLDALLDEMQSGEGRRGRAAARHPKRGGRRR
jgi:DNA-binding transcriptional ArsR family regulator